MAWAPLLKWAGRADDAVSWPGPSGKGGINDAAVARAVLSASPLASGITKKEADFARVDAEERFARPAVRLRDSIGKLTGLLETAINATEARFGPLCGVGESPAAKAEAALRAVEGSAA